jgi:hypothetical protein
MKSIELAFDRTAVELARNCVSRNEAPYGTDEYTKSMSEYGRLVGKFQDISRVMDQIEAKGCGTVTGLLSEMAMDIALNEYDLDSARPGTDGYMDVFRRKIDLMNTFKSTLRVRDSMQGDGEF